MSKNFNTKGYAWVDNKFLDDERLHYYDVLVYIQLCRHANVETDETFISQGKLADKIGISRPTVNKAIKHLVELGYIETQPRARKNGGRTTSIYRILDAYEVAKSNQSKADLQGENGSQSKHDLHEDPGQSKHDLQEDPAKVNLVNNINNTIINKSLNNNNSKTEHSNMSNQLSLFDIPSKPTNAEEVVFSKRRGKSRSLEIIELYRQGRISIEKLDMMDLCYFFTVMHKEIVGSVISVVTAGQKSESDMGIFMRTFDLNAKTLVELMPKVLEEFLKQDEQRPRGKRQNKLNIGNLAQTWFMEPIMDKVKPKVNEKYLEPDEPTPVVNPNDIVDEIF